MASRTQRLQDINHPEQPCIKQETVLEICLRFLSDFKAIGKPPATYKNMSRTTNLIDEYINNQDPEHRSNLYAVRDTIREQLPSAEEKISWSIPTWWKGRNIIHFAAAKRHIGIYPGPEAVEHFAGELTKRGFKFSKGAIQIPYGDNLPLDLIAEISRWCGERNSEGAC